MNGTVYLFAIWQSRPKYHDYGRIKTFEDGSTGDVTVCGLVMYDGKVRYNAVLREDHARSFATPCRKCFEVMG